MAIKLEEVTSDEEFDKIWPMLFEAFAEPRNDFFQLYNPIQGTREQSLQASKERNIRSWHDDPSSHWLKVMDTTLDEVIAAACWHVHKEPPALPQAPFDADWHPEGSDERRFANLFFQAVVERAGQRMHKPHVELDQIVTHPAHRRKGAAALLMQWGIDKADLHGLEACIESVPSARPVYERYGFVVTDIIDVDMTVPDPSERWKELQQLKLTGFYMWRPRGGKFVKGETVIPWHTSP